VDRRSSKFQLTDQNGAFLQGLPAADIGFAIAQLVPGQNGSSSQWNSYIYGTVAPAHAPAASPLAQRLPKLRPRWKPEPPGRWLTTAMAPTNTRSKRISPKDPKVIYSALLTHRVGFEIRNLAQANNAAYTFQPSSGATTGIFSREIVDTRPATPAIRP
jgi:hypothetical protein